ncbi:hypothetical protein [Nocardia alni]|uniref:hypothetical protein n=1 Tax=Nocardia alni TaxID=2815723 RepID=UPI001C226B30|nr:hypothetical protein [Nocardia alni]
MEDRALGRDITPEVEWTVPKEFVEFFALLLGHEVLSGLSEDWIGVSVAVSARQG